MTDKGKWIDTPGLKDVLEKEVPLAAKLLADGNYPVLVRGASRTGKSHIRDKIWEKSGLKRLKEGVINCAAIPSDLTESLLFGHKKGAFTGAIKDKNGLLFDDSAPSKLVFLEEIGELPKYVQAKLLVFFDTGSIMPVGANWGEGKKSNLRIIATSNAGDDQFRPDFLARFWEIKIPPIHERREDIPYFLNHFLKGDEQKLFTDELFYLMTHNWPGGVTEIEKVCIRIAHHCLTQKFQQRNDYVRRLISDLSYFDASYPYGQFCHHLVWHEEDHTLTKLFPHFCMDGFYHEATPRYEIHDLVREWKAWCYFFKEDPKSPSKINEIIGESITKYSSRELISDFEMVSRNLDNICRSNSQFEYFVDFLKSQKLWNEEGLSLLNNLRKSAFEEFFYHYNSDEDDDNINEAQKLPSFEQTSPNDYRDQFWAHQVKLGRKGREIEEIYGINRKTAQANMRKRKHQS